MNNEIVSVSRLKEIRCGTVQGRVSGTVSKAILYDSTDKIELVVFGEIPLKPGVLYQVRVEELVLGDCVPVRSPDQILLVQDSKEPTSKRCLRSNKLASGA